MGEGRSGGERRAGAEQLASGQRALGSLLRSRREQLARGRPAPLRLQLRRVGSSRRAHTRRPRRSHPALPIPSG